jgi:Cu/Ag efflux protein CusF
LNQFAIACKTHLDKKLDYNSKKVALKHTDLLKKLILD